MLLINISILTNLALSTSCSYLAANPPKKLNSKEKKAAKQAAKAAAGGGGGGGPESPYISFDGANPISPNPRPVLTLLEEFRRRYPS